jgi:hypothetical protein
MNQRVPADLRAEVSVFTVTSRSESPRARPKVLAAATASRKAINARCGRFRFLGVAFFFTFSSLDDAGINFRLFDILGFDVVSDKFGFAIGIVEEGPSIG